MGSSLQMGAAIHRVQDIALESVALHTVRVQRAGPAAWVTATVNGLRRMGWGCRPAQPAALKLSSASRLADAQTRIVPFAPPFPLPLQVGAWLLYDDAAGRRHLACVPLSFKPGEVEAGALVGMLAGKGAGVGLLGWAGLRDFVHGQRCCAWRMKLFDGLPCTSEGTPCTSCLGPPPASATGRPLLNNPHALTLCFASLQPTSTATEVLLIEDQLKEGCQSESAALEEEACKAAESQLAALGGSPPQPAALAAALADVVLAPGRLSRSALAAALATLGSAVQREEVLTADLQELRQQLPRWVAGAAATAGASAAAAGGGGSGGSSALLSKWTALLQAYAAAWQQQHLPLALLQLPPQGEATCTLMLARRGGLVTALRPAAAPELAVADALPSDWHQSASEAAESATFVLGAASAVARAAGGSQLARLLWASMREGTDMGAVLLPALVRALAGGAPASAAAAGASSGRLGFPGGAAAPASAHAQWRTACRKLPLHVARLCSSAADSSMGGFAAAVAAALDILSSDYEDASRMRSSLPAVTKPIRAAVLATLAQVRGWGIFVFCARGAACILLCWHDMAIASPAG